MPRSRKLLKVDRATIRIHDLALRTVVGINAWERTRPQDVVINLSMTLTPPGRSAATRSPTHSTTSG